MSICKSTAEGTWGIRSPDIYTQATNMPQVFGDALGERQPMTILAFSDLHEPPSKSSDELRAIIRMAKEENARLISIGDTADMIPYGLHVFMVSGFRKTLLKELDGYPIDLLAGNHDPERWLRRVFAGAPNIHIHQRLEFYWEPMDAYLHFRHGHDWTVDWGILRHVAPFFVRQATEFFPEQWYWFCERMEWIPSELKRERRYHFIVRQVWENAVKHAIARSEKLGKDVVVLNGHTHAFGALLYMFDRDRQGYIQADSASLAIGSYMRIGKRIEFCRL